MEAEKAKKTRRKETEKSGTKEGDKEKRAKTNEEAMLEQKAKEEALKSEALDFYRQLIERGFKPTIDGASIDFHRNKDLTVFVPGESPLIAIMKHEELFGLLEGKQRQ